MSSTNRGAARHNDDFYRTPEWCTRAILPFLPASGDILDPCCGDGAILDCFDPQSVKRVTCGLEIDPVRASHAAKNGHLIECVDSLESLWPYATLIITNPPFFAAEEFIRRAIRFASSNHGTVAFLLRLAFCESEKRIALHRDHPSDLYPLAFRPSFVDSGKTDSCAYAWFVWDLREESIARRKREGGIIRILPNRPPKRARAKQ